MGTVTGHIARQEVLQDLKICLAEESITESKFLAGYKGIKAEWAYRSAFTMLKKKGLVKVEADGCLYLTDSEADNDLVPQGFVKLLGRKYWHEISEKQLWAWIEAIGTSRANNDSLQNAIEACGSEDLLLQASSCLARWAKKYGPEATWLEIFGHQRRAMWRQGEFTRYDDLCLLIWCAKQLEELEKGKKVA